MSEEPGPVVLNANQRRHFEVMLAQLEDSLNGIEALLAGPVDRRGQLTIVDDDVPDEYRAAAMPVIESLRRRVAELAAALDLPPRTRSLRRSVAAVLSVQAIRVEDSLSRRLRGYGEVHASVARLLDPILADMADTLNALSADLRHQPRPTPR